MGRLTVDLAEGYGSHFVVWCEVDCNLEDESWMNLDCLSRSGDSGVD